MVTRALVALGLAALGACSVITDSFVTNDFSGDPFPTYASTATGALLIGVEPAGFDSRVGVLDVMSPFTVIDPGVDESGQALPPSITNTTVTLRGRAATSAGDDVTALAIPRAQLDSKTVMQLHPCGPLMPGGPVRDPCTVGPEATQQPFRAIVGSEALAGDALRLRLGDDQLFLLADIGGDELDRGRECDAVFPEPFRGGGTLVVAGTEVGFSGRRVILQACMGFDTNAALPQTARGADINAVLSTGIGVSLLSSSAYDRYRLVVPGAPPLSALTDETVFFTSGPIVGKRVSIDRMALVADSTAAFRAPCRQVYAHNIMAYRNCGAATRDCPCSDQEVEDGGFCSVPAIVELTSPANIEMLVVPDTNVTLSALRTELRPDQPEIDAVFGTQALQTIELDIDYPHNRVLARCAGEGLGCAAKPALPDEDERDNVRSCILDD